MGSKIIYLCILVLFFFVSCGCPEEDDIISTRTSEQKVWLSEAPNDTSIIYVKSSNGLSDIFIIYFGETERKDKTGNTCSAQEVTEKIHLEYFSGIAGYYFYFDIFRNNNSYVLNTEVKLGGNISSFSSRIMVDIDNPNNIKSAFFYPYSSNIDKGYLFYGDSVINGKSYSDLFIMNLPYNEEVKPLTITQFIISKRKGLVAYKTKNGADWYLEL